MGGRQRAELGYSGNVKQGHQSHRDLNLSELALQSRRIGATGRDFTLVLTPPPACGDTGQGRFCGARELPGGGELELRPAALSLQGIAEPAPLPMAVPLECSHLTTKAEPQVTSDTADWKLGPGPQEWGQVPWAGRTGKGGSLPSALRVLRGHCSTPSPASAQFK